MKVEQFRCETCRSASCRSKAAPSASMNSSFSRSSVTLCDSANACSLCCRSSSTHGPTSQPSTLRRMLLSECILIEILSTACVPLNNMVRASCMPDCKTWERESKLLQGLKFKRRTCQSARVGPTIYRGQHWIALRGHDISWLRLGWKFDRFRASSCGCEEYSDGGSKSSRRRADLL